MANAKVVDAAADEQDVIQEEIVPAEELDPPTHRHAAWLFVVNMGSGNESDQQIQALFAPRYQLARRGISFASSPRHANIVLLTGVLTRRALEAVQATLATVPDPHAVIAVGDGALNGGVFADSPEVIANAAELFGVNVEIAGNPPTPVQILRAIEEAAHLLDAAESGAAEAEADEDEDAEDDVVGEDIVEDDVMEEEGE